MARASTLILRRFQAKRKLNIGGVTCYADATDVGTIIDPHDEATRRACPITLERFLPAHRPPSTNPPKLMANPIVPTAWHVVECYGSMDTALPRAAKAKNDPAYRGAVLRIRDRRDNMIIMCAILG
jgi:hypothetical protein